MKNKSIYRRLWAAIGLVVFVLTGCMDDTFVEPGRAVVDENGMVHLRVNTNVPGLKLTRAVDINGEAISTLWLLAFDQEGYMISRVLAPADQQRGRLGGRLGNLHRRSCPPLPAACTSWPTSTWTTSATATT